LASLILGLTGGAAFAYFTSPGSGSGVGNVGTAKGVSVVAATGTVTNKLYPGASGDLSVTLNNPNSVAVKITSLSAGTGSVTGSGGLGTCTTTGVSVNAQSGLSISVSPGGSVSVTIPNGVTMSSSSDNGCQDATFQVPLSITVHLG
jgi:hypothetical protein